MIQSGDTPLHWAISCSRVDIVVLLISNGADVNIENNVSIVFVVTSVILIL